MARKGWAALGLGLLLLAPDLQAKPRRPKNKGVSPARMLSAKAPAPEGASSAPAPIPGQPSPRKPALQSSAVLVLDQRTGESLVEKRVDVVLPVASLTKLLTAMVVLDVGLDLETPLRIEDADVDRLRNSRSRLPVGTELTRREAILLALMASENRAAHALGRSFPGGVEAFVGSMNAKAQALGMMDSRFEDPTGLSGNNVASPRDLARLVDAAHTYPLIRDFSTRTEARIPYKRRFLDFCNTNALVRNSGWNIGLSKTGYIEEAGRCLVMQAQVAGRPLLIVLLDSWGKYSRQGDAIRIKTWLEGPVAAVKAARRRRR